MIYPQSLLIEKRGQSTLGREEALMSKLATARGVTVTLASLKQVERGRVPISISTVAIGSIPFVKHALRHVGKALPEHDPYPECLQGFLLRRVKKLPSLRLAKERILRGERLFIKPADGWKKFTGFVADDPHDIRFNGVSSSVAVWISEPVCFVSEWRAYVANNQLRDVRFVDYGGNRSAKPDMSVINDAVSRLAASQSAPSGYVMDFGVLAQCGSTALVELNDGFSFGAYDGLPAETYWAISVARWAELTQAVS